MLWYKLTEHAKITSTTPWSATVLWFQHCNKTPARSETYISSYQRLSAAECAPVNQLKVQPLCSMRTVKGKVDTKAGSGRDAQNGARSWPSPLSTVTESNPKGTQFQRRSRPLVRSEITLCVGLELVRSVAVELRLLLVAITPDGVAIHVGHPAERKCQLETAIVPMCGPTNLEQLAWPRQEAPYPPQTRSSHACDRSLARRCSQCIRSLRREAAQ